ncbi:MAG: lysine biosynthesis protein LysW [Patescibacteria group bacterium]|nr:lysine biosynthesis protein LysW [Patescibacteria group bacterium]
MFNANCPICGSQINFSTLPEENELLNCGNCNNRLVTKSVIGNEIILAEAPNIEEDWGE